MSWDLDFICLTANSQQTVHVHMTSISIKSATSSVANLIASAEESSSELTPLSLSLGLNRVNRQPTAAPTTVKPQLNIRGWQARQQITRYPFDTTAHNYGVRAGSGLDLYIRATARQRCRSSVARGRAEAHERRRSAGRRREAEFG